MSARTSRKVAALPLSYSDAGGSSRDEGEGDEYQSHQLALTVTPQRIHYPASNKSKQPVWPESESVAPTVLLSPHRGLEVNKEQEALQTDMPESIWARVSRTFFGYDLSTWNCTTQSSTEDTHTTLVTQVRLVRDVLPR